MGGSVNFTPANQPGQGNMAPYRTGIPANRQLTLTPRTQPMARPQPGRPMTDSSGRVIGGPQAPTNRFMQTRPGMGLPGGQPGGPQIGFGMPPGGNQPDQGQQFVRGLGQILSPATGAFGSMADTMSQSNDPFVKGIGQVMSPATGAFGSMADTMSNFTPPAPQPDGAPSSTPSMGGGKGGFGGGKGGFGGPQTPSMISGAAGPGFGTPGNFSSAMGMQGSPTQSGAQFSQNT